MNRFLTLLDDCSHTKYRIVRDGNGDIRLQYCFTPTGICTITSLKETWHWDPRVFDSQEQARRSIGAKYVAEVLEEVK
jgi:hypothetical protein